MVKIAVCRIHVFKVHKCSQFPSNNICQDKYKFKITRKWNFLSPHSDMSLNILRKNCPTKSNAEYKLCINCGRKFVWEMTYALQSSNISSGGNILLMKIKIKCPTGKNLEIMTFRYLKNLVFDKFFKEIQHYLMFLFSKSIISDN